MEATALRVRWMIRKDLPEVLKIEQASFASPWSEQDFIEVMTRATCCGKVAENKGRVFGYMVYDIRPSRIELLSFAVAPQFRRRRIGKELVVSIIDSLDEDIDNIRCHVSETNLTAQLFLRSLRFRCERIKHDYFDGEDAYVFRYRRPQ